MTGASASRSRIDADRGEQFEGQFSETRSAEMMKLTRLCDRLLLSSAVGQFERASAHMDEMSGATARLTMTAADTLTVSWGHCGYPNCRRRRHDYRRWN